MFGTSREQANALTFVLLLGTADGAYEATRRITGLRLRVSDAGLGAIALREAALGGAGPSARVVPGFGALVAFALQMIPRSAPSSSSTPSGSIGAVACAAPDQAMEASDADDGRITRIYSAGGARRVGTGCPRVVGLVVPPRRRGPPCRC